MKFLLRFLGYLITWPIAVIYLITMTLVESFKDWWEVWF